ncbi:hypothetical protein HYW32_02180 [Candidatus Berkelbacteria bacterium]|nr:hypothetical protein [Candidatus Berkelbacteria bacterium]
MIQAETTSEDTRLRRLLFVLELWLVPMLLFLGAAILGFVLAGGKLHALDVKFSFYATAGAIGCSMFALFCWLIRLRIASWRLHVIALFLALLAIPTLFPLNLFFIPPLALAFSFFRPVLLLGEHQI